MFGDFILYIRDFWKQFWCIHNYKFDRGLWLTPTHLIERCQKCGRVR